MNASRLPDVITRLKNEIALNREFVDDKEAAFLSLVWTWQRIEKTGRAFFTDFGITDTQFNTLMILWDYREIQLRQSELAELVVVNRAGMGAVIDRMQTAGWIKRQADPSDRRAWFVALTDQGLAKLKEVRAPYYRLLNAVLGDIENKSISALLRFNDDLRARLTVLSEAGVEARASTKLVTKKSRSRKNNK